MTDQRLPKAVFRERLRTYLIGVGIGSVMAGFLFVERARFARMRQQEDSSLVESGPPGDGSPATGSSTDGQP